MTTAGQPQNHHDGQILAPLITKFLWSLLGIGLALTVPPGASVAADHPPDAGTFQVAQERPLKPIPGQSRIVEWQRATPWARYAIGIAVIVVPLSLVLGLYALQVRGHTVSRAKRGRLSNEDLRHQIRQKYDQIRDPQGEYTDVARSRMTVQSVMTQRVTYASPTTSAGQLRELMGQIGTRHVLIREDDGRLVGIVSDRDVQGRNGKKAREIMTAKPVTVAPDHTVSRALSTMLNRRISCLPVMDQARVCGIITTTDLLMALACLLEHVETQAEGEGETEARTED